jgi:hypothetical protein
MICASCHIGHMLLMKFNSRWRKCPVCGFCAEESVYEVKAVSSLPARTEETPLPRRDYESDADSE